MATGKQRFYALDVLRGVAIMIMLFVDAPPALIAYPIFIHAPWEGLTFADLAFPGFVFAMGMSAALSMAKREPSARKIFKRVTSLFVTGILFNALTFIFAWMILPDFAAANFYDAAIVHGRPFGILQRLALTYALGILIARAIKTDTGIFIAAFILLIVSSAGYHIYAPENPFDEAHNLSSTIDFIFPGANHIYTPTHDPEGLYGTIATTASFLIGFLAGRVLLNDTTIRDKIFRLTVSSVMLLLTGTLWSAFDIVSKNLWTTPYALITSALEILLFAALMWLFDTRAHTKNFFRPLCAAGMNPLFMFLFVSAMFNLLNILPSPVEGMSIYVWLYLCTFYNMVSPEFGSMIFCSVWCLLWLPLAKLLYRRGIVIKI